MSAGKHPNIFWCQMEAFVYVTALTQQNVFISMNSREC